VCEVVSIPPFVQRCARPPVKKPDVAPKARDFFGTWEDRFDAARTRGLDKGRVVGKDGNLSRQIKSHLSCLGESRRASVFHDDLLYLTTSSSEERKPLKSCEESARAFWSWTWCFYEV
jgi:hypothetical protein